jgi:hypothetical protein
MRIDLYQRILRNALRSMLVTDDEEEGSSPSNRRSATPGPPIVLHIDDPRFTR